MPTVSSAPPQQEISQGTADSYAVKGDKLKHQFLANIEPNASGRFEGRFPASGVKFCLRAAARTEVTINGTTMKVPDDLPDGRLIVSYQKSRNGDLQVKLKHHSQNQDDSVTRQRLDGITIKNNGSPETVQLKKSSGDDAVRVKTAEHNSGLTSFDNNSYVAGNLQRWKTKYTNFSAQPITPNDQEKNKAAEKRDNPVPLNVSPAPAPISMCTSAEEAYDELNDDSNGVGKKYLRKLTNTEDDQEVEKAEAINALNNVFLTGRLGNEQFELLCALSGSEDNTIRSDILQDYCMVDFYDSLSKKNNNTKSSIEFLNSNGSDNLRENFRVFINATSYSTVDSFSKQAFDNLVSRVTDRTNEGNQYRPDLHTQILTFNPSST